MITDLSATDDVQPFTCDVCILGSGAAGLAIATELMGSRLNVIVLESGGIEFEPQTQALYEAEISGLPHPGSSQGRFRTCGGSTTRWGGQALPLMTSDFERRDWVANSGWPISFQELTSHYLRASRFLSVDENNFDTDLFSYLRARPPLIDPERVWYHFSKWSPQPNIRETYLPKIKESDRCRLLLHANVVDIALNQSADRVEAIRVRSLAGKETTVNARAFVVCAGGIETARILLANNRQQIAGIGNQNDLVGRFFQDHPNAMVGRLNSKTPDQVQQYFNVFHKHGLKYSVRLTATSEWQRRHKTLNTSMGVIFVQEGEGLDDLKNVYAAVRRLRINSSVARKLLRLASNPTTTMAPVWRYLARGRSYTPNAQFRICLTCEQEPNPESRVSLSDKKDALGIRRANVHWQLTDLTRYTMQQFADVVRDEFRRSNLGEVTLDDWIRDVSPAWVNHINDQFHHIGTTRMHDSPRHGVVDRDCKVHGISNLYVGSSAVFPTSGHSNPTLTIIALCMRLSDKLKRDFG